MLKTICLRYIKSLYLLAELYSKKCITLASPRVFLACSVYPPDVVMLHKLG